MERNRRGESNWNRGREKKKGSDLEEADREKMTVPREGERLFSGAH